MDGMPHKQLQTISYRTKDKTQSKEHPHESCIADPV